MLPDEVLGLDVDVVVGDTECVGTEVLVGKLELGGGVISSRVGDTVSSSVGCGVVGI